MTLDEVIVDPPVGREASLRRDLHVLGASRDSANDGPRQ